MSSTPHRVAGRPATPILTQQRIVEAAFSLLDEGGAEDFSMGKLARSLGVRTPALYNHVDNRQHLINLMRRDMIRSIDRSLIAELRGQKHCSISANCSVTPCCGFLRPSS